MLVISKLILKLLKFGYLNELKKSPSLSLGKNVRFGEIHYFEINKNAKNITIGDQVKFYSQVNLTVGKDAQLTIGKNTTINKYSSLVALKSIEIGENCLIGENVKIYDNNHKIDVVDGLKVPNHKDFDVDSVKIGNNVWLASNVTILKGVTVGDNTIIGAGCVIFKDVPSNTVIVFKQDIQTLSSKSAS